MTNYNTNNLCKECMGMNLSTLANTEKQRHLLQVLEWSENTAWQQDSS